MFFDLTDERDVVQHMKNATSLSDWIARRELVRAVHYGQYPSFWADLIVESGLLKSKLKEFKENENNNFIENPIRS